MLVADDVEFSRSETAEVFLDLRIVYLVSEGRSKSIACSFQDTIAEVDA